MNEIMDRKKIYSIIKYYSDSIGGDWWPEAFTAEALIGRTEFPNLVIKDELFYNLWGIFL